MHFMNCHKFSMNSEWWIGNVVSMESKCMIKCCFMIYNVLVDGDKEHA